MKAAKRPAYRQFSAFLFVISAWLLIEFFQDIFRGYVTTILGLCAALYTPIRAEAFFRNFLSKLRRSDRSHASWLIIATSSILFSLLLFDWLYSFSSHRWYRWLIYVYSYIATSYCTMSLYFRGRRTTLRADRMRTAYLSIGGIVAISLIATNVIPGVVPLIPAVGNVVLVVYFYLIAQSLFRSRILDLKETLARILTLVILVLIVSAIYWLLLIWVGRNQPGIFLFNTIVGSVAVLLFYDPLRNWMDRYINRLLFFEEAQFARRLDLAVGKVLQCTDELQIADAVTTGLLETHRVTGCRFYLADAGAVNFNCISSIDSEKWPMISRLEHAPVFDLLREERILTREDLRQKRDLSELKGQRDQVAVIDTIREFVSRLATDVMLPVIVDDVILGLLCLRDDRIEPAYSSSELNKLQEYTGRISGALRNTRAHALIRRRDHLAALGEMSAGLAHEIRNPLGAIKGAAQLIQQSPAGIVSDGRSSRNVDIIVEEVNRLNSVVTQFLDFARPGQGKVEVADVNMVTKKSISLIDAQKVEVVFIPADIRLFAKIDPRQLKQVVINLAINAVQAMNGQGRLTIRNVACDRYYQGAYQKIVEIRFEDTGPGIDAKNIAQLFVPFYTTKDGGTGLGLPISQRIVEQWSGIIELQKNDDNGAIFSINLPTVERTLGVNGVNEEL